MKSIIIFSIAFILLSTNSLGQFKKLSSQKLSNLYSGELVIIDVNYSDELKENLKNIFSEYSKVTFSKDVPTGNKAILQVKPVQYYLPMGNASSGLAVNKGGLKCLQISKGDEDIIVPMPTMEYAEDESLRGTTTEGQIILASRMIAAGIEWSKSNGKGYDFETYLKNSAKENIEKLPTYSEIFIRDEDVLFRKGLIAATKGKKAEIVDVSSTNPKMKNISIKDLDAKILSKEKFAVSYVVETSNGTFKLIVDGLSGKVLLKFKHEVSSYWDGFNKPALTAVSKAL